MPVVDAIVECSTRDSLRARQVAEMFDLPVGAGACSRFSVEIPSLDEAWSIGAIVGPSGSGKTTIARKAFGDRMVERWDWPADMSILDGFPGEMETGEITRLLGSVGFSSPPAWLRPFRLLSNGEQFRVNLARALAEQLHLAPGDSPGVNCEGVIPNPLLGLTWHKAYQSFFYDQNGNKQTLVGDDQIVFTPEPSTAWIGFLEGTYPVPTKAGIVTPAEPAVVSGMETRSGMFAYGMASADPPTAKIVYGDTFLPVLKVPSAVFVATVNF